MKKMLAILLFLFTTLIPEASFPQKEITKYFKDLNKLEILNIKNELRDNIKTLSLLKKDLKQIYISMTSSQARDRFLIIQAYKTVEGIEGIYMYVEDSLEQVLFIKKDRISYYCYLKKHNIEKMRGLITQYLNDIHRMYAQISRNDALHLIDKAKQITRLSSELLDKGLEILEQHINHKEARIKRDTKE